MFYTNFQIGLSILKCISTIIFKILPFFIKESSDITLSTPKVISSVYMNHIESLYNNYYQFWQFFKKMMIFCHFGCFGHFGRSGQAPTNIFFPLQSVNNLQCTMYYINFQIGLSILKCILAIKWLFLTYNLLFIKKSFSPQPLNGSFSNFKLNNTTHYLFTK